MSARQMRALRGVAAAIVSTLLAATAHTIGGGAPSPLLVATTAALAAPLGVALIGRRSRLWRTVAAVTAAQAVFHVVFALFGTPGAVEYGPMDHAHMSMPLTETVAHPAMTGAMPDSTMIVAHAIAAAVTILALRHGERLARAILRGIRSLLPRLHFHPPAPLRIVRAASAARTDAVAALFPTTLRRRGPPLLTH